MQKETNALKPGENEDALSERTRSENTSATESDNSADIPVSAAYEDKTSNENPPEATEKADFEELIKGPYKDAFAKKVQSIINKRFKEQKIAESKSADSNQTGEKPDNTHNEPTEKEPPTVKNDSTYDDLIKAGVDPDTAYRVLHLDEIMDSSMRYGAELAAKHLADSIRQKAARPHESALTQKGYSAKTSATSLTPEKRKELARKALMGEQIGF